MGWWIAFGILVLLLMLPIGVNAVYDRNGPLVRLIVGPLRFVLFPGKKKKPKKEEKPKAEKSEPAVQPSPAAPQPVEQSGKAPETKASTGSLTDFLPLAELALKMVGDFFGKTLHVDVLYLKLTMAGDDPCDLAVNYGRAWAALGNFWPKLEDLLVIKKRDIRLQCDFESSETHVEARVDLTVTLGRTLALLICYGVRILVRFFKIRDAQKKAALAETK